MTFQAQTILLTVFGVLMAAAAIEDFRRLTIPNLVPAALCLLWPAYAFATAPSLDGALAAAGCALAVFLVGAVFFARGWLGRGRRQAAGRRYVMGRSGRDPAAAGRHRLARRRHDPVSADAPRGP